jgi:hypothetical protein
MSNINKGLPLQDQYTIIVVIITIMVLDYDIRGDTLHFLFMSSNSMLGIIVIYQYYKGMPLSIYKK